MADRLVLRRIVRADLASWADLQVVLGARGAASRCRCQRYKLEPRQSFASRPVEERSMRLRDQTCAGLAEAPTTGPVGFAPAPGARSLAGYPLLPVAGRVTTGEEHMAFVPVFLAAGFREAARPGTRRAVLRIDFRARLTGRSQHRVPARATERHGGCVIPRGPWALLPPPDTYPP